MLALRCPLCNAVAPIAVSSTEHLSCDSCGGRSGLPESARTQLLAAADLLKNTDIHARQLSRAQREALLSGRTGRKLLWSIYGVFFFASATWAASTIHTVLQPGLSPVEMGMFLAMGLLPIGVIVASAVRSLARLTARRRALAELCGATPAVAPGAPLRCRVCAGPVEEEGTSAVATCGYCGADNLVAPAVLERTVARHHEATRDLAAEVEASLTDVNAAARSAWIQAIRSAVLAPVAGLGTSFLLVFASLLVPLEVDQTMEYVVVEEEGSLCLAAVADAGTIERRRGDHGYELKRTALASASIRERGNANRFVGRKLRMAAEPRSAAWSARAIERQVGGRNSPEFAEDEAPDLMPLEAFCFADSEPGSVKAEGERPVAPPSAVEAAAAVE